MREILRLTKWEWFKLRRLRMPWILLAIALLVSQLGIWVNYLAYHNDAVQEVISGGTASYSQTWDEEQRTSVTITCADVVNQRLPSGLDQLTVEQRDRFLKEADAWAANGACDNFQDVEKLREGFVLPNSIAGSISGFSSLGPIAIGPLLIMILAASLLGTEYGWGTLRTILAGGIGRWKLLSAKLLLLLRLCSEALIVISLVAALSSLAAAFIPPEEAGGVVDSGRWSDVAIIFFKALYGLLPFMALSVLATVLTSSHGVGIALSIGYFVVESIIGPLLNLNDALAKIADYLLIQTFRSWTTVPVVEDSSDILQTFFVILAYTAIFVAATAWMLKRRDIGGAMGD